MPNFFFRPFPLLLFRRSDLRHFHPGALRRFHSFNNQSEREIEIFVSDCCGIRVRATVVKSLSDLDGFFGLNGLASKKKKAEDGERDCSRAERAQLVPCHH